MKIMLLVPFAVLITACALTPSGGGSSGAQVERGHQVAEAHCATCHAVGSAGDSPAPEAPAFRNLSQNFRVATLQDALTRGISTGHPAMPNLRLPKHDVDALVAYLQSIQAPAGS